MVQVFKSCRLSWYHFGHYLNINRLICRLSTEYMCTLLTCCCWWCWCWWCCCCWCYLSNRSTASYFSIPQRAASTTRDQRSNKLIAASQMKHFCNCDNNPPPRAPTDNNKNIPRIVTSIFSSVGLNFTLCLLNTIQTRLAYTNGGSANLLAKYEGLNTM